MNYRTNEDRRCVDFSPGANIIHKVVVADLSAPVVTVAEFKIFARLEGFTPVSGPEDTFTYDDSLITEIIATATGLVEHENDQLVEEREVTVYATNELGGIRLPWSPAADVTVTAEDEDGNVISDIKIFGGTLTTTGTRMVLTYDAGHATVPSWMKQAILRKSLKLYEDREKKVSQSERSWLA